MKLTRFMFLKPIKPDRWAIHFKESVKKYNGLLNEEKMCIFLSDLFNIGMCI